MNAPDENRHELQFSRYFTKIQTCNTHTILLNLKTKLNKLKFSIKSKIIHQDHHTKHLITYIITHFKNFQNFSSSRSPIFHNYPIPKTSTRSPTVSANFRPNPAPSPTLSGCRRGWLERLAVRRTALSVSVNRSLFHFLRGATNPRCVVSRSFAARLYYYIVCVLCVPKCMCLRVWGLLDSVVGPDLF